MTQFLQAVVRRPLGLGRDPADTQAVMVLGVPRVLRAMRGLTILWGVLVILLIIFVAKAVL